METVDILIVVFAAIAVVGSAVGTVLYEPPSGGPLYDVTYAVDTVPVNEQSGNQAGSGALELVHPVALQNLTSLSFQVVVSSTPATVLLRAQNIGVAISVKDPRGTERATGSGSIAQTATSVTVVVEVPAINPLPNATTVRGETAQEAQAAANETAGTSAGQGDWTVTVTLATGQNPNEQATITSTATAGVYRAVATPQPVEVSGAV